MKAFNFIAAAVVCSLLISCSQAVPVVTVENGQLQGVASGTDGVTVFRGVPYAKAPVGELRWQLPRDAENWEGVRLADTFGPICPQADLTNMDLYGKEFYSDGMPQMSEDCLYLNVWAPSKTLAKPGAKLPVAMWIHGGAYDHGWGFEGAMDGEAWAERGVILVTINYRVGIFGFYAHPELTATEGGKSVNYGMYDQVKALKWVYDNIAQFGGDPQNITVLGQSAGARSVQYLCASELSKKYIAKAIIQSGNGISKNTMNQASLADAQAQGISMMEFGGYESLDAMRQASQEELLQLVDNYRAAGNRVSLRPCTDNVSIEGSFSAAAYGNKMKDMPYMIGSVTGDGEAALVNIDNFCNVRDSLSTQPVYEYEFIHKLPGNDAGAFHSAELWYTFGTLGRCWRPMTEADYALSAEMLDAWTGFARTGNPGLADWPAYKKDSPFRKYFDIR